MKAENDSVLVAECLNGNSRAYEVLVGKYERPIFNLALRMVKDYEDAADVAQTVFVKAYENLRSYNPAHQFFSWIYRIAINESINFAKKRKTHEEYESGRVASLKESTPEEALGDSELAGQVGAAILRLKTDYRMVIVLKHYHDFSYEEMAEILDIPEKTVKSRLYTARQLLQRTLTERGLHT